MVIDGAFERGIEEVLDTQRASEKYREEIGSGDDPVRIWGLRRQY